MEVRDLMNTFVNFTEDDLEDNIHSFFNECALTYPSVVATTSANSHLYRVYTSLLTECKMLIHGYTANAHIDYEDSSFEPWKIFWLLCNMNLKGLASQLQSFVIKTNDPDLNVRDYILFFYISLQDAELQSLARDLPLDMLYDMLMPVAVENFNRWRLDT
jgi:hypothetical protein